MVLTDRTPQSGSTAIIEREGRVPRLAPGAGCTNGYGRSRPCGFERPELRTQLHAELRAALLATTGTTDCNCFVQQQRQIRETDCHNKPPQRTAHHGQQPITTNRDYANSQQRTTATQIHHNELPLHKLTPTRSHCTNSLRVTATSRLHVLQLISTVLVHNTTGGEPGMEPMSRSMENSVGAAHAIQLVERGKVWRLIWAIDRSRVQRRKSWRTWRTWRTRVLAQPDIPTAGRRAVRTFSRYRISALKPRPSAIPDWQCGFCRGASPDTAPHRLRPPACGR